MATTIIDAANAIKAQQQASTKIYYAGKILPDDRAPIKVTLADLTNNPSLIQLTNKSGYTVTMPLDTETYRNGKKVIAISKILDGPPVTERITVEADEIEFEGTIREQDSSGQWVFPQTTITAMEDNVWQPATVLKVTNTLLNQLGILELVVADYNISTVRGTTNVPYRLKCYNNVPGSSLNISSS